MHQSHSRRSRLRLGAGLACALLLPCALTAQSFLQNAQGFSVLVENNLNNLNNSTIFGLTGVGGNISGNNSSLGSGLSGSESPLQLGGINNANNFTFLGSGAIIAPVTPITDLFNTGPNALDQASMDLVALGGTVVTPSGGALTFAGGAGQNVFEVDLNDFNNNNTLNIFVPTASDSVIINVVNSGASANIQNKTFNLTGAATAENVLLNFAGGFAEVVNIGGVIPATILAPDSDAVNLNNSNIGGQLIVEQINNANGTMFVGTAFVPEPSTYAAIFGGVVFVLAIGRRLFLRRY
ncbi:MAG: collagen-binding domain-containing protein [Opitutales bacterium]